MGLVPLATRAAARTRARVLRQEGRGSTRRRRRARAAPHAGRGAGGLHLRAAARRRPAARELRARAAGRPRLRGRARDHRLRLAARARATPTTPRGGASPTRRCGACGRCPASWPPGATSTIPFGGSHNDSVILAEGYLMKPGESVISPAQVDVTPGYFEAMGVKLLEGRFFEDKDTAGALPVAIVDRKLAAPLLAGPEPDRPAPVPADGHQRPHRRSTRRPSS